MLYKIISTLGLGVLGIDPFTAIYLLAMGVGKETKTKISLFFVSFGVLSVQIGAILATIFGTAAVDILKKLTPGDESPFWACLNFAISGFLLVWVLRKLRGVSKNPKREEKKIVGGSGLKYLITGTVFALTSFTDPTYYAVILMGGESHSFLVASMLLSVWFLVSQCMAVIVYLAIELNLLSALTETVERFKQRSWEGAAYGLYGILLLVAIVLLADAGYYLFAGRYLL